MVAVPRGRTILVLDLPSGSIRKTSGGEVLLNSLVLVRSVET